VLGILFARYDSSFVLITLASLSAYVVFTIKVSNWRIAIRRKVNDTDSAANTRAIDSLLNYETVKYFNNEEYEARRYDQQMQHWEDAATRSQVSLSWLNLGQQIIIALGVTVMMWRAADGVVDGTMTIGDLVLVNAFLIQLVHAAQLSRRGLPRDSPGTGGHRAHVRPAGGQPGNRRRPRRCLSGPGAVQIRFSEVDFSYEPNRQILHGVDFDSCRTDGRRRRRIRLGKIDPGAPAVPLLRRQRRPHPDQRQVDLRHLTQTSLRSAIGIVPQDTVLFNDTIYYNIQYGQPEASREQVLAAAAAAQLSGFIELAPRWL
jgi:ABC-type transport system involved in Fe-S cluster assembly fused permease/ATPase subunit